MPWLIHWVTVEIHVKDLFDTDRDVLVAHNRKVLVEVRPVLVIDLERVFRIEQIDVEAIPSCVTV